LTKAVDFMKNPDARELYNSWSEIFESENYFLIGFALLAITVFLVLPLIYGIRTYQRYNPKRLHLKYSGYIRSMPYYLRLNPLDRKRFELRVQLFINTKNFISRGKGFELRDEMIAKISASAVEISFGFQKMDYEHFTRILIYPNDYYSNITRKYHAGEVNLRGFIVLSWQSFAAGYADYKDGKNLGIHEMAHALKLENRIQNGDYHFLDASLIKQLQVELKTLQDLPKDKTSKIIRSYGLLNIHEFFAVLCENFLERPQLLQEHHESLYDLMTNILLQNPLKEEGQFAHSSKYLSNSKGPIKRY
jgi:Mlc titration factor MtfA (ptsG expression regulator)